MSMKEHVNPNKTPHEPSYVVDIAEMMDQPHEVLAEMLRITPEQAQRVIRWAQDALDQARHESKARTMAEVLARLTSAKAGNLEAVVAGLLFASGAAAANGVDSQAEMARRMTRRSKCVKCGHVAHQTVTRALISHYTVRWAEMLGLENFTFRRGAETQEKCREARRRVVERERQFPAHDPHAVE